MDFEIMDWLPTPAEKYLGIVRVKAFNGKVTLRFKIMQKKDGSGYFPASASLKGPDVDNAASYLPAFAFDSTDDREELDRAIRQAIKRFVDPASVHNVAETKAIPIEKHRAAIQDANYRNPSNEPLKSEWGSQGPLKSEIKHVSNQIDIDPNEVLPF
jgi:hypothetical protein